MKRRLAIRTLAASALGLLVAGGSATAALAHDVKLGALTIDHPWARATPGQAKNGAAFVTIHNGGANGDQLVSAAAEVAKRIELHTHMHKDGVMQMREVEAIEVPANGMATLKPGGYHVMLIGLHAPLKEGERFPLTLTFKEAGSVTVEVAVESVGSMGSASGHDGMKMDHGGMKHGEGSSN